MGPPVSAALDDECPPTRVRYLVLASLCLAATIAYVPRIGLGVAEGKIRSDLGLTEDAMGWVMSAFFLGYAVFQIPAGWLGHIWGTRRALALFAFAWSLACGAAGLAAGLPALFATRLGMGVAQAGIFPCSASSVARWFPARRWGLANGLLGSCMQIGAAAAALLTGVLLGALTWRWLFVLYALPGLAWSAWFFAWFRDRPEEHPGINAAELDLIRDPLGSSRSAPKARLRPEAERGCRPPGPENQDSGRSRNPARPDSGRSRNPARPVPPPEHPEPTPWVALITSPAMLCICGQQFFRAAGYMFYASWFATFLRLTRGTSTEQAGILTSLPIGAVVAGSAVGGLVSDWVLARTGSRRLSRQGLSAASMLACAFLIVWAYFIEDAWSAVLVISTGSFCSSFAGPCAYTITIDMGGKHVAPVFSTMNMAGNIGAAVFPLLVPPLVAGTGNWNSVLFLFAGIYLAAALCWVLFNPDGTVFDRPGGASPGGERATLCEGRKQNGRDRDHA